MASDSPSLSTLLGMGAVIAALLVVGMAIGWLLDSLLDTSPICTLVGLALGIIGAVGYTVHQFRQYLKT